MSRPILHHYDTSPFAQKAQKMLGIKQLAWYSVVMPRAAPKPDIERLTGGYRGTPVLQLGADLFVDNRAIGDALDRYYPDRPGITSGATMLINDAVGLWTEELFDPVLRSTVVTYSDGWGHHFRADRQKVFSHLDFETLFDDAPLWTDRILAMIQSLDAHLAAHGPFFAGDQPGLTDVQCWGIIWFIRKYLPSAAAGLGPFRHLAPWEAVMADIGVGEREEADFSVAWEALARADAHGPVTDESSRLAPWTGHRVSVDAKDSDRGTVTGELLAVCERAFTVAVAQASGRVARVHFPRIGYHIRRC